MVSAVDCFSRGSRSVPAESLAGGGYCEDAEMAAGAPVRASGAATTVVQPPAGVALHASIEEELEVVEVRVTGEGFFKPVNAIIARSLGLPLAKEEDDGEDPDLAKFSVRPGPRAICMPLTRDVTVPILWLAR
ncbi:MAG: hypothetical protein NTW94_09390 [Legionellales bacterium]|nr:hypothetical protein [Legionellales bacterium]